MPEGLAGLQPLPWIDLEQPLDETERRGRDEPSEGSALDADVLERKAEAPGQSRSHGPALLGWGTYYLHGPAELIELVASR